MSGDRRPVDYLDVRVIWRDETVHGVTLSGRLERTVRERLYPRTAARLLAERALAPAERRLTAADAAEMVRDERRRLHHRRVTGDPAFWRPDAARCVPEALAVSSDDRGDTLLLGAANIDAVHAVLAEGAEPATPLDRMLNRIDARLAADGWVRPPPLPAGAPIFVGHACVSLSDGDLRLWTDPFLRPKRARYAPHWRPLSPTDVAETRHAVLITHAHPDHFDPGSLLRFPRDTAFVVPALEAETPLALDTALRLRQLGFEDVRPLAWGETLHLGGFEVRAFPFHGEQPLSAGAEGEHADRNAGNLYHVADPSGRTHLFLADAGADPAAPVGAWTRAIRQAVGRVDVLFANHRTWRLYPPQYLLTSVPQYLAYVPDAELERPQQIMMSVADLRDAAVVLGARAVVPYAMGGAPWFAELGLGYDHASGAAATEFDAPAIDPFAANDPDAVLRDGPRGVVMLPGQALGPDLDPLWPPGYAAPPPDAWTPAAAAVEAPVSVAYGAPGDGVIADLVEITRLDPGSYVIAMPEFAEVVGGGGAGSQMLFDAADRLSGGPAWRMTAARPLTSAGYADTPEWTALFAGLHAELVTRLREGELDATAARALLGASPFDAAPAALIADVCEDLLGFRVDVAGRTSPAPIPRALAQAALTLPAASRPQVERWGLAATGLALLIVKSLHNVYATAAAAGRPLAATEPAWFAAVLGPE